MSKLYDMIVKELYEKKCISALINLLDGGRELSFKFDSLEYAITWKDKKIYLDNQKHNILQEFEESWQLIEKSKLYDIAFLDAWEDIELLILY